MRQFLREAADLNRLPFVLHIKRCTRRAVESEGCASQKSSLEFAMAIRWDKFTVKAQEAIQRAGELAGENGNPEIVPAHLLAALVEDKEGIVQPVLEKIGIGPQAVLNDA